MRVSSRSNPTNTHLHKLIKTKAAVIILFMLLIPGLHADSQKEYIYQEEKAIAVESDIAPVACTFSISTTSASPAAGGGSGSVNVTSPNDCLWTVINNASSWVTITGGGSGAGDETVSYTVSANNSLSARSGTLSIAGKTFTINQAGVVCTYGISPTSTNPAVAAGGGSGSISVTSSNGICTWTTTNNASSWVTITGGGSGTGNGTVNYTVSANNSLSARSGTLSIAGKTFTINQAGVVCSYGISPISTNPAVAATGGSGSVNVTSSNGICTWTASNNASSWVTITGGSSGTGNGTVSYTVSANTAPSRSGTLTIAGNTFTINQADGCAYFITPTSVTIPASGVNNLVFVGSSDGCTWTTTNHASSWVTITGGGSGDGNGLVSYSVSKNSGQQRTGTMTVAGKTLTISQQSGMTCQQMCGFHREFCENDMPDCSGYCAETALAYCGPYNFLCAASYLDACIPNCESQHLLQCAAEYNYCISNCN